MPVTEGILTHIASGVLLKILMELSQYGSTSNVKHGRITDFDAPADSGKLRSFELEPVLYCLNRLGG